VKLAVGEVVVYAAHGVGRIVAREKRALAGGDQEMLVLELEQGLTVTLPVDRAHQYLRPPLDAAGMRRVQQTLEQAGTLTDEVWLKRKRETEAKLKGGDPVELAEVVRDGAQRARALAAGPSKSQLSPGEKGLYLQARRLLCEEIHAVRGVADRDADTWIEEQLGHT
jgi:CarD family transcriptional regulator